MDKETYTEPVIAQYQPEHLVEFEKMLGVGTNYTPEHVLKCFEVSYLVKKENDELDQVNPFIEAKNHLLRHLVSSQMKAERYFEINPPFKDSCPGCSGTGELYKFTRKIVQVNCHICAGKKKIKVKCPSCEGTGRFQERWKGGGGIDVSCKTCRGKKKVAVKCSECLGTGKKPKNVPDYRIKSTTPCKRCKQLGFMEDKPTKPIKKRPQPANPVLTQNLADKIKETIVDQIKQDAEDALIDPEGTPI